MPAEVETMFSVREVPWHGLGTIVQEAPTSADALHLAGLDWTVEPKPIYNEKGDVIPGYIANTRNTDGAVLGMVSGRYKLVQNVDAFNFTDSLIGEGDVKYETAGSLKGGKTIWLLARMPRTTILGDDIDPYLCFTNSHDGFGSIKAVMTPTRVVCNNTLNLALQNASRCWSTKHIGNLEGKLAEARMTLKLANEYMDELAREADKLVDIKIDEAAIQKALDKLFPITGETTERQKQHMNAMRDGFISCYYAPDIKKFEGTGWGLIQAAADFSSHAKPARMTANAQENRWSSILLGDRVLDTVYNQVIA